MAIPLLRVDHYLGYDLVRTDGTLDFDGGTLIVWRDQARSHIVGAWGPSTMWMISWDENAKEETSNHGKPIRVE